MKPPFFSIVVPTRGRPELLRNALVSALRQDFEDFEVVVSDNFNDEKTQSALEEFGGHERLRCVRTDRLLNMPEHWDFATQHARGEYVLILTDRSVLKQGALTTIHEAIISARGPVEVCSWCWSLYEKSVGWEYAKFRLGNEQIVKFLSIDLAEKFCSGLGPYVFSLPRGLNSCYKRTLMKRLRAEFGSPFKPISPDYTLAFTILANVKEVLFINQPLFISQERKESNGIKYSRGIDTGYLRSLGDRDLCSMVPIKVPLLTNALMEDFLVVKEEIGGNLSDVECDWPDYFERCYKDLLVMESAGIRSSGEMAELFDEWKRALNGFDQKVGGETRLRVEKLKKNYRPPVDPLLCPDNEWRSALEIAGF